MKEEHDNYLCKKYNKIFRDPVWEFEHSDGWFKIIDTLCSQIQHHIDWSRKTRATNLRFNRSLSRALRGDISALERYFSHGKPVTLQVRNLALDCLKSAEYRKIAEAVPQVVATQVKEKYGTLRFYYVGGDDYTAGLISMAEGMSSIMCEECGDLGKVRNDGWVRTLCDEHAKDRKR